jgi:hypothetical protein
MVELGTTHIAEQDEGPDHVNAAPMQDAHEPSPIPYELAEDEPPLAGRAPAGYVEPTDAHLPVSPGMIPEGGHGIRVVRAAFSAESDLSFVFERGLWCP